VAINGWAKKKSQDDEKKRNHKKAINVKKDETGIR